MGSTSITAPLNIRASQRRARALELRLAGMTFRRITEIIKQEFGDDCPPSYNERHCWNDIDDELRRQRAEISENASAVLDLELQRLDQLLLVAMNRAMGGDMKAVDRVLKIMERRSRFLGLDVPVEHKVNTWQNEIIDLLRQGKITVEEVRKELGDELFKRIADTGSIGLLESGEAQDSELEIIEGRVAELSSS